MLKKIRLFEMYCNSRECAETADKCADLNKRMLNCRKCADTDLNYETAENVLTQQKIAECCLKWFTQQRMCCNSR